MANTLGYHCVKSTYGQWLPGDDRGHWSAAWDEQIGFIEPHMLHASDPVRRRMAEERMKHDPVWLSEEMIRAVAAAIGDCVHRSRGDLAICAATIVATHFHVLIPYSGRDINSTAKWPADQTIKAVYRNTGHTGPVWCGGKWRTFIFERSQWENARSYIERHNVRSGLAPRPFPFITGHDPPD